MVHLCILVQTLETTIFVLGRLLPVTFSIHPLDGFWQKIDIKQRNRIEFPCSPIHCHFFILHHIPFTVQITKKKSPEKQTWLQYKTRDLFFFYPRRCCIQTLITSLATIFLDSNWRECKLFFQILCETLSNNSTQEMYFKNTLFTFGDTDINRCIGISVKRRMKSEYDSSFCAALLKSWGPMNARGKSVNKAAPWCLFKYVFALALCV